MPNRITYCHLLAIIGLFCFPALSQSANVKTLDIGSAAPDFSLPGVDGKTHALKDFADAKILCVIFTCNHCPTAQAYEQRIIDLYKDYHDKGVALVAINPNSPAAIRLDELGYSDISDSLDEMKVRAKERNFPFHYLYDGDSQKVAHAYGVLATPHVFIFDAQRKLRYNGSIDDSEVKTVTKRYARDAIDALLAGKPVAVEKTRVFGCSTKWIEKEDGAKKQIEKWNAEPVEIKEIDAKGIAALAANDSKNLRLINVWATWCGPCTAELPELAAFRHRFRTREFELITLSIDDVAKKDAALKVLQEDHAAGANYLYSADDKNALASALDKEWPGPVPYTLLIAPGGKVIYRHSGEINGGELMKAILDYLGRTYK
ncbi:MAG TPA: redoxin domain-containing protein [Tepidisphaeraceae bacterium]|jgi:peroxiredoxin|nr:redoxin domain-containing protein [Tepidisphaeraceae bacterium]